PLAHPTPPPRRFAEGGDVAEGVQRLNEKDLGPAEDAVDHGIIHSRAGLDRPVRAPVLGQLRYGGRTRENVRLELRPLSPLGLGLFAAADIDPREGFLALIFP